MTTNAQQVTSWINAASPDDLVLVGKTLGKRISDLSVQYRQQFVQSLPARTFEGMPEFAKHKDVISA